MWYQNTSSAHDRIGCLLQAYHEGRITDSELDAELHIITDRLARAGAARASHFHRALTIWAAFAVVGIIIAVAGLCMAPGGCVAGVHPPTTSTAMPTATRTPTRATVPADTPTAAAAMTRAPTPTPMLPLCPEHPSQWSTVPYEMSRTGHALYTIHPPCVMEQVEAIFWECVAAGQGAGRQSRQETRGSKAGRESSFRPFVCHMTSRTAYGRAVHHSGGEGL